MIEKVKDFLARKWESVNKGLLVINTIITLMILLVFGFPFAGIFVFGLLLSMLENNFKVDFKVTKIDDHNKINKEE